MMSKVIQDKIAATADASYTIKTAKFPINTVTAYLTYDDDSSLGRTSSNVVVAIGNTQTFEFLGVNAKTKYDVGPGAKQITENSNTKSHTSANARLDVTITNLGNINKLLEGIDLHGETSVSTNKETGIEIKNKVEVIFKSIFQANLQLKCSYELHEFNLSSGSDRKTDRRISCRAVMPERTLSKLLFRSMR